MGIDTKRLLLRCTHSTAYSLAIATHHKSLLRRFTELLFYGNYFYGICVVASCVETSVLRQVALNDASFYLLMFTATVLYYNYPYARNYSPVHANARTLWHIRNRNFIKASQVAMTIIVAVLLGWFVYSHYAVVRTMDAVNWLLLLLFPAVAALYYGANFYSRQYDIRRMGLLKPFIIGFIWAGIVTIYPELFNHIISNTPYDFPFQGMMLFVKNTMFIAMLAIMFDVKDYAADSRSELSTFIVKLGLRKTIFYILVPLPLLGLVTFICYAIMHRFHIVSMCVVMVPFLLLIPAALSFRKRRPLMYYLVVIDGLILLKALLDIFAALYQFVW